MGDKRSRFVFLLNEGIKKLGAVKVIVDTTTGVLVDENGKPLVCKELKKQGEV